MSDRKETERVLHCWAEPEGGGWTCMAEKHDDERHRFFKDSRIMVSFGPAFGENVEGGSE